VNSFSFAVGGGADYKFSRNIIIRFIQADYLFTHFAGVKQNNARIQAGIIFRFGR
jgi:opacity protein-like surface antigen